MPLAPTVRRLALTLHIVASVGWIGAVAAYLALALVGLSSHEDLVVRATDAALEPVGWFVILPLCLASLATGLTSSLGSPWGLFRHWWVVIKLVINVLCTLLLLMHLGATSRLSSAALEPTWSASTFAGLRADLALKAGAAIAVLLVATVLTVYKPRGLTPYGHRRQTTHRKQPRNTPAAMPPD